MWTTVLVLIVAVAVHAESLSAGKRSHHGVPIWLDHCWDINAHMRDPFCDLLTSTTTTTTTTSTTTTTTTPTTTTTEPTTTTTTEPTTTTTEPTTTTTTLAPTTTARSCHYVGWEESGIDSVVTGFVTPDDNMNRSRNASVHVKAPLQSCQTTCERSFQEPYECWAITYNEVDKCHLYYYSGPLYIDEQKRILHKMNGSALYLKRCSDDPITPAPSPVSTQKVVVTTQTPVVAELSTVTQTHAVTDKSTTVKVTETQTDTTASPVTHTPMVIDVSTDTHTNTPMVTDTSTSPPVVSEVTTKSTAAHTPIVTAQLTTVAPITQSVTDTHTSTVTETVSATRAATVSTTPATHSTAPATPSTAPATHSTAPAAATTAPAAQSTGITHIRTPPPLTTSPTQSVGTQPIVMEVSTSPAAAHVTTAAAAGGATTAMGGAGGPGPIQTQVPQGGVLAIDTHSYGIIGVPSPIQNTCFFQNQTFPLGGHFQQTCRYDCECTDVASNKAVCTDVCPDYTAVSANCHIVHLPTKCCAEVQCDNTTVTTNTTTAPCDDVQTNCDFYPDSSCTGLYESWARANCALRCGYCPGTVAPCVNRLTYCEQYDLADACIRFEGWARYNCKQSCNMCHTP